MSGIIIPFPLCSRCHKLWFICIVVSGSKVTSSSRLSDFEPCCKLPLPDVPLPHARAALNSGPSLVLCVYMCFCHWCGFSIPEQAQGLSHRKVSVVLLSLLYHPPTPSHTHILCVCTCMPQYVRTQAQKERCSTQALRALHISLHERTGHMLGAEMRIYRRFFPVKWINCERPHSDVEAVCFRWWLCLGFWCYLTGSWISVVVLVCLSWQPGCCSHALMSAPVCPCRL